MKHWEKNKKDLRRSDDRDFFITFNHPSQDNKKKKLKPVEKTKYRGKSYGAFDEMEE